MSLSRFSNKTSLTQTSKKSLNPSCQAYERIFNKKLIMTQIMPKFLFQPSEQEGIRSLDILKLNISRIPSIQDSSRSFNNFKSFHSTEPEEKHEISVKEILNSNLPHDEVILKLNKTILTRKDLLCFKEGSDLSAKIVDCYMSIIKATTKKFNHPQKKHLIVLNSKYSKILFSTRSILPKPKQNIFDHSYLFIPVFDSYWSLIVVNLKSGLTTYFDALMPNRDIQSLITILKSFLIHSNIANVENINDSFIKIQYPVHVQDISLKDTGVYICKIAEFISHEHDYSSFDVKLYRQEILLSLLKISQQL